MEHNLLTIWCQRRWNSHVQINELHVWHFQCEQGYSRMWTLDELDSASLVNPNKSSMSVELPPMACWEGNSTLIKYCIKKYHLAFILHCLYV